jgi:hypothetical protein
MRYFAALALSIMAKAQTIPIDVHFNLYDVTDNYGSQNDPLPGATVRLILGAGPDWQSPTAGYKFVTDQKGEVRFTANGLIDKRWRSQNIGFTPFSWPVRSEHMQIAAELEHRLPLEKAGEFKTFRWVVTMDLDCFSHGQCSTVGFMGIYTPDAQGRFTKALQRTGPQDSWKVPEMGDQVLWGHSYTCADFGMSPDENDPNKRVLKLAFKRLPRAVRR